MTAPPAPPGSLRRCPRASRRRGLGKDSTGRTGLARRPGPGNEILPGSIHAWAAGTLIVAWLGASQAGRRATPLGFRTEVRPCVPRTTNSRFRVRIPSADALRCPVSSRDERGPGQTWLQAESEAGPESTACCSDVTPAGAGTPPARVLHTSNGRFRGDPRRRRPDPGRHMAISSRPTLAPGRTGRQDLASSVPSCPKSAF